MKLIGELTAVHVRTVCLRLVYFFALNYKRVSSYQDRFAHIQTPELRKANSRI